MKYQCPCCGCFTYELPLEESHGDICPVCFWENDSMVHSPKEKSACNYGLTLEQARINYLRTGACQEAVLEYVRPPRAEEQPEKNPKAGGKHRIKAAVIGAGSESLHTIQKAHQQGLFVIALDGNSQAPGLKEADCGLVVDISCPEDVITILGREKPDFVLTVPVGRYLTTTGAVNDALSLPGITKEMALLCTDKFAFHKRLYEAGLRNCHCYAIEGADKDVVFSEKPDCYPVILKPRFGSGSRGICMINSPEELQDALLHMQEEEYVLEDCVPGEEYGIDGAVVAGKFYMVLLRRKVNTPPPVRQAVGYFSCPADTGFRKQVEKYLEQIIHCLGLQECLFHCDLIKGKEGPFVIELSARPSGHNLHNLFTPLCTGVDMAEEYIKYRTGRSFSFVPAYTRSMMIHYFDGQGTVVHVPDESAVIQMLREKNPRIRMVMWRCQIEPGEMLAPVSDGHSIMGRGYYILEGDEETRLLEAAKEIMQLFFQ